MTAHAIGVHHGHRKPHQRRSLSSLLPWHLRARSASETTAPDALSRGGHPEEVPVQDSATGEAAPLAAPVRDVVAIAESAMHATMSEPFGTVSFTGLSTAGQTWDHGWMHGEDSTRPQPAVQDEPAPAPVFDPDPAAGDAAPWRTDTVTDSPPPLKRPYRMEAGEDVEPVTYLIAATMETGDFYRPEPLLFGPECVGIKPTPNGPVAGVRLGEDLDGDAHYVDAASLRYCDDAIRAWTQARARLAAALAGGAEVKAAAGPEDSPAEVTDAGAAEPAEADAAPLAAETEPEAAAPADEPAGTAAETADSEAA